MRIEEIIWLEQFVGKLEFKHGVLHLKWKKFYMVAKKCVE